MPNLLAFDTSTEVLAVCVQGASGFFAVDVPGGASSSAQLLPTVQRQLQAAGLTLHALDAIAFGRGPGAFTGLRASCAVAQGLALGLSKPLLPLDSLLVVAEDAFQAEERGLFAVAMDARMDEIYGAVYRREGRAWVALHPPALYTLAAWNERLSPLGAGASPLLAGAAGSAIGAFNDRLLWPASARRVDKESGRAAALGRLALRAWSAGEGVDAAQALPLYLRDKVALTSAEREQRRSAAAGLERA